MQWRKVWGHVKSRGNFVNFYLEVETEDGFKIFRSATVSKREIAVGRIDFYKWVLDGMVREIQAQLDEHRPQQ